MKYLVTTITLLLLLQFSSNAQISSYDITKFTVPDLQRSSLEFSSALSLYRTNNGNQTFINGVDFKRAGLDLNMYNQTYRNTRSNFSTRFSYLDVSMDISKTENADAQYEYRVDAYNTYSNKFFFQPKRFINFGLDANARSSRIYNQNQLTESQFYNTKIPLSIGIGRKEFVSDAWYALTILDVLRDEDLLLSELSHEQIDNFAMEISKIINARSTDARIEEINEYKRLVSYLVDNKIANAEDYRFFAILHDIWKFERNIGRQHGTTNQIGIEIDLLGLKTKQNSFAEDWNFDRSYDLKYQFEDERVLSTDFQASANLSLSGGLNTSNKSFSEDFYDVKLGAGWNLQYYPNFRTNYLIGMSTMVSKNLSQGDHANYNVALSGEWKYYVSPQFRWRLTANVFVFNSVSSINQFHSNTESIRFYTSYFFY